MGAGSGGKGQNASGEGLSQGCDWLFQDPCCSHRRQERGASRSPFTGFLTLLWNLRGIKDTFLMSDSFLRRWLELCAGRHDRCKKLHGSQFSLLPYQNQKNSLCFPVGCVAF